MWEGDEMNMHRQDNLKIYNEDCMKIMSRYEDNYFDLAVVDPPYGIGISSNPVRQQHKKKKWDDSIPQGEYFSELIRVSKNQIIWGGNYFFNYLGNTQGFLIWDKKQPHDFSLAMCELAWTSIQKPAKMFRESVLSEKGKIHPTQKPVKLYNWIYKNYAKEGQKILDTHLGSGSNAISAHYAKMGEFVGCELDKDYYEASIKRIHNETRQLELF